MHVCEVIHRHAYFTLGAYTVGWGMRVERIRPWGTPFPRPLALRQVAGVADKQHPIQEGFGVVRPSRGAALKPLTAVECVA